MIRYPGHVSPKLDDETVVSSIDLAPTILRACGMSPTDDMTGINLLDEKARSDRESIYGEVFAHDVFDLDTAQPNLRYQWAIQFPWKLIAPSSANVPDEPVQLYHLLDDPFEQDNAAEAHPELVKQLQARIAQESL